MNQDILKYLRGAPCASADQIAAGTGHDLDRVQAALIALDDSGHVLMRHGIYRLSEAAKKGLLE